MKPEGQRQKKQLNLFALIFIRYTTEDCEDVDNGKDESFQKK